MKKLLKYISAFLASTILASSLVACGNKASTSSTSEHNSSKANSQAEEVTTGFPISKEGITLKFAVMKTSVQPEFPEIKMIKKYQEMTNMKIEWEVIPSEFLAERRNIIMASNQLPDAFMRCGFSAPDIESYSRQGMFIKLDELIESVGPNFKATLNEFSDINSGIRMSDGGIYSLPYIVAAYAPRIGSKLFFNNTALNKTGAKLPTTIDEFYQTLKTISKYDLNGNGKNDEIALSGNISEVLQSLGGAWGLNTRGVSHTYVDIDKSGKLRFIPTSNEYKELLQFVSKLNEEKLLDNDTFTLDYTKLGAKGEDGRVLSFPAPNHMFMGQKYQDDYVGLTEALQGPNGDKICSSVGSTLASIGSFVITNTNKYPTETMRWVDYFYGDEGMRMYFMGEEGVSYEKTADGTYQYLPIIQKNPNGLSYEQALSQYVPWAGGLNPTIAGEKYFKGAAMKGASAKTATALSKYAVNKIWPPFIYSEEDNQVMSTLKTDIGTYVDEMSAQFITKKKSFDQWDAYVAEFKKIGIDDYMRIYEKTSKSYE